MPNQPIPKIFELIVDNAQKRRSQKADEAGKLFVLGQLTVAEYIAVLIVVRSADVNQIVKRANYSK